MTSARGEERVSCPRAASGFAARRGLAARPRQRPERAHAARSARVCRMAKTPASARLHRSCTRLVEGAGFEPTTLGYEPDELPDCSIRGTLMSRHSRSCNVEWAERRTTSFLRSARATTGERTPPIAVSRPGDSAGLGRPRESARSAARPGAAAARGAEGTTLSPGELAERYGRGALPASRARPTHRRVGSCRTRTTCRSAPAKFESTPQPARRRKSFARNRVEAVNHARSARN